MIHVVHFIPSVNCTSGIANMIMNYYRRFNKSEFKFYFIYFLKERDKNFLNEIESLGGFCYKVESPNHFFKFRRQLRNILMNINSNIEKGEKKIFHNHQISFTIFLYNLVRKTFCKKIIVHNHLTKYSDKFLSSIRNCILCYPIKFLKLYYFACSIDASKIIFGKKNKVHIINNGIEIKKYLFNESIRNKKREELGISENDFIIGDIGRLEPQKNYFFVLKVFKKILEKKDNAKLIIVGKGYQKVKILKYINKINLKNKVILLENRKDIPELLCSMDAFIFPSKFEGLGIVAIEAESNGLPTFISDKVPKVVAIVNCIIINLKESEKVWADKIVNFDYKNINRKQSNLIMMNTNFNIEKNVFQLEKIYKKISNEGAL